MKNLQIEDTMQQGSVQLNKDFNKLVNDNETQIKNFGEKMNHSVTQVEQDVNSWIENGISSMNNGFETLTDEAKEAINDAAAKLKKNTGQSFKQYNSKIQQVADKVPGGFSKKVSKYPWVTISIAVIFGLFLGGLLKLARRSMYS
jgi:ElaB/YqjD/DUF883 family membrane-anchored ribosome-binding protein